MEVDDVTTIRRQFHLDATNEKARQCADLIVNQQAYMLVLVEKLGEILDCLSNNPRQTSMQTFALILETIPKDMLSTREINCLLEFFRCRITDPITKHAVIDGFLALSKSSHIGDSIRIVIQALFCSNEVHVQSQSRSMRRKLYNFLDMCFSEHVIVMRRMSSQLVGSIIKAVDGEKDPELQLIVFRIFSRHSELVELIVRAVESTRTEDLRMAYPVYKILIAAARESTDATKVGRISRMDLVELSDLIGALSAQVSRHQEPIDSIQNNVSTAKDNVREGTRQLAIASKLHKAMLPVGGAAVGALVGGPVGFFAGLKIGAAAALTGGAVGYGLGRVIKLNAATTDVIELNTLDSSATTNTKAS